MSLRFSLSSGDVMVCTEPRFVLITKSFPNSPLLLLQCLINKRTMKSGRFEFVCLFVCLFDGLIDWVSCTQECY